MKILMLLDNPFTNDRRVYREATTLVQAGHQLTLLCSIDSELVEEEWINGIFVKRMFPHEIHKYQSFKLFNKLAKRIILDFDFDIIHAHDQAMLNLGVVIKNKCPEKKIIYDSHELFHAWPLNTDANFWISIKSIIVRKLLIKREKRNIKNIDGLISVNVSIIEDLKSHFKLSIPTLTLRNIPELPEINFASNILRQTLNISVNEKILVYIGANVYPKTINIEQVLNEFRNIEGVSVVFICKKNWGQKAIENYCLENHIENVYFHDLIPPDQIPAYLSSANVGIVSSWNKKDLSYWYGLDNKLFEYMMSEIPILATQQPEYIKIVDKNKLGICVNPDEKNAYLSGFNKIIDSYLFFKENIIKTKEKLHWDIEKLGLIEFYKNFGNI